MPNNSRRKRSNRIRQRTTDEEADPSQLSREELQEELRRAREELRRAREELRRAREELRRAREELRRAREELRRAREERDAALHRRQNDPEDITQKVPSPDEEESYLKPKNVTDITAKEMQKLLAVSPDEWNDIRCCVVHDVLGARLKWERPYAVQKPTKIAKAVNATNATFPFLRKFESSWVTRWFVKTYWKSRQDYMRRKRQGKVKSRRVWSVEREETGVQARRRSMTPEQENDHNNLHQSSMSPPLRLHNSTSGMDDFDDPHNFDNDNDDMDGLQPYQEEHVRRPPLKRLSRGSERPPKRTKIVQRVVEEEVTDDDEEGAEQ